MAEVAAGLPEGSAVQRWQLDAYADEPYCENFRGVCARHMYGIRQITSGMTPAPCSCQQCWVSTEPSIMACQSMYLSND